MKGSTTFAASCTSRNLLADALDAEFFSKTLMPVETIWKGRERKKEREGLVDERRASWSAESPRRDGG
jgi:hypothetical protein